MTYFTKHKIRSLTDAAVWRQSVNGLVVFTNGVFDLVHPGHIELLEAARAEGDALVVGLNTDASVRRLGKGNGRPVVDQASRARVLAAFAAVDCVVLFDQDTPYDLITGLEPDVLVKGADYSRDRTVGADFVEARGGRVKHVELITGFSTSALVERLRAST